jgi:hypothetical protein
LKDVSRRAHKLRRKVYRQTPVATWNRVAELDHIGSYAELARFLEEANLGLTPRGAAFALRRACAERGLRAWCYEFGFPECLTHTVTVVEANGILQIHDPFFNLSFPDGFHELLDCLRGGNAVKGEREIRDRKIYIMDPACEPEATARWLERNADREIEPVDGLRRFELLWNPEAFAANCAQTAAAYRAVEERGHPPDLQFMMLHPVSVFDGEKSHRIPLTMPLLAGRELASPLAALRASARKMTAELASQQQQNAGQTATISRLEAESEEARCRLAAASDEARRLGERVVQLQSALDAETQRFTSERQALLTDKEALEAALGEQQGALARALARVSSSEAEIAVLKQDLARVTGERGAERSAFESSLSSLQAAAGMLFEQDAQALREARSSLDAAVAEHRLQRSAWEAERGEFARDLSTTRAMLDKMGQRVREVEAALDRAEGEREMARAELGARVAAWERSPWGRLRSFLGRRRGRSRGRQNTHGDNPSAADRQPLQR